MAGGHLRIAYAILALALTSGCAGARYGASFKSNGGAAMAKPGVSPGRLNTVRIADIGGPLTRAGLLGLSVGMAAGAVKVDSQTTTSHRSGDYIVTTTTTTGHIDAGQAAAAGRMAELATADEPIGLQASLEIASTSLGGDASGWMYNLGYGSDSFACAPGLRCRIYGGFQVGKFVFHDRLRRTRSSLGVLEEMDVDSSYWAVGTPLRLDISPIPIASVYVGSDINWVPAFNQALFVTSSPSPWHAGVELTIKLFFARAELTWSRMDRDTTSAALEVGVGF
jgi:hypothetical protein